MSDLTQVELLWLESRIENRIRFGRVAEERILDRRRRVLSFAPGSIYTASATKPPNEAGHRSRSFQK